MTCILLSLAKATAEEERKPKSTQAQDRYRRDVCEKEGHTHGPEKELDCALMRISLLHQQQAGGKRR